MGGMREVQFWGGPRDGERIAVQEGARWFEVPVLRDRDLFDGAAHPTVEAVPVSVVSMPIHGDWIIWRER
jgi:hypothetical protein